MLFIKQLLEEAYAEGYIDEYAEAKVCQDILLFAIANSDMSSYVTIKGGIVMRSITHDIRRATQDIDIDFIRYPLSEESINQFFHSIDCLDSFSISKIGVSTDLKHQDYHGKRVYFSITDSKQDTLKSKIDFGVHKHLSINQESHCFEIDYSKQGITLLINTKEQMFTEKLRSLLVFGSNTTRFKDIFDLYYLYHYLDNNQLLHCINTLIINDKRMKEDSITDIIKRLVSIYHSDSFLQRLNNSKKNWLSIDAETALHQIILYIKKLKRNC